MVRMSKIKFSLNDCFNRVKKLPDNSVDLFYVDPPYGIGYKSWDKSRSEFTAFTEKWVQLLLPKLKENGAMVIFMAKDNLFANKNKKIVRGLINILEDCGIVHFDNWATWKRQKGRGSKKKLKSIREEIIHFTKSNKYAFNHIEVLRDVVAPYVKDGRPRGWFIDEGTGRRVRWTGTGNVWMYSSPQWNGLLDKQRHSAQKPFLLVERVILMYSNEGDFVVDPFMGSGSCAFVCKYHNRDYLGIEMDKQTYLSTVDYYKNNKEHIFKIYEEKVQRVGKK